MVTEVVRATIHILQFQDHHNSQLLKLNSKSALPFNLCQFVVHDIGQGSCNVFKCWCIWHCKKLKFDYGRWEGSILGAKRWNKGERVESSTQGQSWALPGQEEATPVTGGTVEFMKGKRWWNLLLLLPRELRSKVVRGKKSMLASIWRCSSPSGHRRLRVTTHVRKVVTSVVYPSLTVITSSQVHTHTGFPCSSVSKESACSAGDTGSIPGLGRSPGEGKGNPLEYPCLENLMDRGAWWAAVHRVAKSQARLSD